MKKFFIIPILIVLLTGIGCTCKNISKTKDTTMDEQLKKQFLISSLRRTLEFIVITFLDSPDQVNLKAQYKESSQ